MTRDASLEECLELPAQDELSAAWNEIHARLRRAVDDSTYELWLAPLELKAWDGAVLLLQAPPATQAWVAKRFRRTLETCAQSVVGEDARVAFSETGGRPSSSSPTAVDASRDKPGPLPAGLNPRYSFDQFIIGNGNRLAHAAALAVAEHAPGQAYNPLFLHAPPGLGKTHLLHAIGNYILGFGGGATVRYTTVEAFTNHFITALSSRSLEGFKQTYRDTDVLLIDDVQFLASKAKTEEEFFHTFNALYDAGRQLVLTCDRLPRQLSGLEERLRERFEAGLVASIEPPDFATRVTILRKRARLDRVELADVAVLEVIAERVTDNVRALEGALIRIVAHQSLTGEPIDVSLAERVLAGMYPGSSQGQITVRRIQETVAAHYEITVEELVSPGRSARVAWPRQVALHLARELTDVSLPALGRAFGGRNHATVLHACKRVSERVSQSPEAEGDVNSLRAGLAGQ